MQVANGAPRDDLTAAQVTALIEAENLTVTAGLELYDADETFIEDISDDLVGGVIDRGNYRTIHSTCQLQITRELQWGSQRVKPYLTLSTADVVGGDWNEGNWNDGVWAGTTGVTARFNLGMFLLSTPERRAGDTPATWDVDGYDKLEILNHPHGSSYEAAAGDAYLTIVEALITGAGESKVLIDQSAAATTLPTTRVWPLIRQSTGDDDGPTEGATTLQIINALLEAVGYRALWVDQDGYYRAEPYKDPADRGAEWAYSADSATTTVAEDRTASADFFDAANRIVAVRNDPAASTFPSEGDGVATVINQSDGPTSIDERGRTITRVVLVDGSPSQTVLEQRANEVLSLEKRLDQRLRLSVSPNPLHGHFDVVSVTDAQLGLTAKKVLVTDWSLPLDGTDMSLDLKAV